MTAAAPVEGDTPLGFDRRGSTPVAAAAWALGVLVVLGATLSAVSKGLYPGLFNADALYLPVLIEDLFRGGRWIDWHLTPSPYLFPDALLALAARAVAIGLVQQVVVYAAAQLGVIAALVAWIDRAAHPHSTTLASGARTSTGLGVLLAFATFQADVTSRGAPTGAPYVHLLQSAHHVGALVVALSLTGVALWLLNPARTRGARVVGTLVAFGVSVAGVASDPFALPWAIVPVAAVLWVFRGSQEGGRGLARTLAVFLMFGAGLGHGLHRVFETLPYDSPYRAPLTTEVFSRRASELQEVLGTIVGRGPLLTLATCIVVVLAAVTAIRWIWRRPTAHEPQGMLAATVCLSAFASAAAVLVLPLPVTSRYLLPLCALPVLLGPTLVATWTKSAWTRETRWVHGILLLGSAAVTVSFANHGQAEGGEAHAEVVACIDDALEPVELRRGVSGYWESKWLMAHSRHPLVVAQHKRDLAPYRHVTSDAFFRGAYRFALRDVRKGATDQMDPRALRKAAGSPARVHACGPFEVWVYARPFETPSGPN